MVYYMIYLLIVGGNPTYQPTSGKRTSGRIFAPRNCRGAATLEGPWKLQKSQNSQVDRNYTVIYIYICRNCTTSFFLLQQLVGSEFLTTGGWDLYIYMYIIFDFVAIKMSIIFLSQQNDKLHINHMYPSRIIPELARIIIYISGWWF